MITPVCATHTVSGTVKATRAHVHAVQWVNDGTAGTITLRDGGVTGTVRAILSLPASATAHGEIVFPNPIQFETDCYVVIVHATAVNVIYT